LRKGPYQVNILLGGYDEKVGGSLYFLDYMASLQKVPYGAQGYAANFCLSIMDREYLPGKCTEEAALKILRQCINELKIRFLISQPNFIIKKVDKEGVTVVDFGADPADN
jgi:20S proteasome alpha/beta subunit